MTVVNKKEPILIGVGDIMLLMISVVASLVLRYQSVPTAESLQLHILPFSIVITFSILAFYISGLYNRSLDLVRHSTPGKVIRAQISNGLIASAMFYFFPNFIVSPKTTLFVYVLISTLFILFWRMHTRSILNLRKKYPALIIGSGFEAEELVNEINNNPQSNIFCKNRIDLSDNNIDTAKLLDHSNNYRFIIADLNDSRIDKILPELYKSLFPNASIINLHDMYEEIFDKIPLSRINYTWIMSHISSISPKMYDSGKRLVDLILAGIVGIFAILSYPFVAIAIKLEDGGPVLISQFRIGKDNHLFPIYKYRSMTRSDSGKWLPESENKVTRVGKFIRKTRIDELPQALAVLKGDMSLIGPRADIIDLGKKLGLEIPYYTVRTVIKPGLSGWAQVNQEKPPQSIEETKVRLSYDLYYIKHRSLMLDLLITLRTLKTLLSREGM
jgi:lipopolysaccharide/colanic/teichoic acid biosynthesis glycosyltransferase